MFNSGEEPRVLIHPDWLADMGYRGSFPRSVHGILADQYQMASVNLVLTPFDKSTTHDEHYNLVFRYKGVWCKFTIPSRFTIPISTHTEIFKALANAEQHVVYKEVFN